MSYTPTAHAKDARLSTLIVDDDLDMGAVYAIRTNKLYRSTGYYINCFEGLKLAHIEEYTVGEGTRITNPAFVSIFSLEASDNTRDSDLTEQTDLSPADWTKYMEIEIPKHYLIEGEVRCVVSAKVQISGNAHVRIYKNGVATGADHTLTAAYADYSDDVTATGGDLIQVYARTYDNPLSIEYFKINADDVIHNAIKAADW